MKLKEIKPGMVIRWESEHEKVDLLKELERLGYKWYETKRKPTEACDDKDIGHVIFVYNDNGYKNITHSNNREEVTHNFSDLILPELTAEEAFTILDEIRKCSGRKCTECPISNENNDGYGYCSDEYAVRVSDRNRLLEICQQWKSEHEKKEPEIEWIWKGYVVGGFDYKEADTEQEAMEWCEYYVKEHPEAKCTYKHVCRVKAVE